MTPNEIHSAYLELTEILTTSGLGWVVDQVAQTVRAGNAVERPTSIFAEEEGVAHPRFDDEEYAPRRKGKPTALMTRKPWPDKDQLLFLIDGIRQAIVRAADVESEQFTLLQQVQEIEAVSFESEEDSDDRRPLRLTGVRDDRITTLAQLLDEMEHEVRA